MKRKWLERSALALLGIVAASLVSGPGHAQQLWKYIDKDGKVIYSDKPPKPGEKAEEVKFDAKANVIESKKAPGAAAPGAAAADAAAKSAAVDARVAARTAARDAAEQRVDLARQELDRAKKNLETGKDPTPGDMLVAVGRGATKGSNKIVYRPEYYERVAALENAVKAAEKKLEDAETEYARVK